MYKVGEHTQFIGSNCREAACLLPAEKCCKFSPFFGESARYYVFALEFLVIASTCCQKETSSFPTVTLENCTDSPNCAMSEAGNLAL